MLMYIPLIFLTSTISNETTWQDRVIYCMVTDRFRSGDISNDSPVEDPELDERCNFLGGDFRGIINKIKDGYFSSLGVNAIWFSPVYKAPPGAYKDALPPHHKFTGYHGYWPVSHREVEPRFGSMEELKELVRVAHSHDIKVVLDLVFNHVHINHPWWKDHPDWFTDVDLKDGRKNIRLFDEFPFTTWFDDFAPTLNHEKEEVRNALIDTTIWLIKETGVDGARLDAVKHMPVVFWKEFRESLNKEIGRDFFLFGETISSRETISSFIGDNLLNGQLDYPLYWVIRDVFSGRQGFFSLDYAISQSEKVYPEGSIMCPFLGTHDFSRFITYCELAGDEKVVGWEGAKEPDEESYKRLRLAFTFLLTIKGTPIILYGDEFGIPGAGDPDNRRMMRFGDELSKNERDILDYVSRLLKIRKEHSAIRRGDRRKILLEKEVYCYILYDGNDCVLVALNNSNNRRVLSLQAPGIWQDAITGDYIKANERLVITLPPLEGGIYLLKEGDIDNIMEEKGITIEHVEFELNAPEAKSVQIAGEFTGWGGTPMEEKNGIWTRSFDLVPGRYLYKFIVDEIWISDPENPQKVPDGFEGFNSVIEVGKGDIMSESLTYKKVGQPLNLIFFWHQHQPRYFKNRNTGIYKKPWVRLHATKDYYDMVAILKDYPNVHFTVNLTPSLLLQILDEIGMYEDGKPVDICMEMTLKPAENLTREEKEYILDNFFALNKENMIEPYSRYKELFEKRVMKDGEVDIESTIRNYTVGDFRDLQVWYNLAWFDPSFKKGEVELVTGKRITVKNLIEKGKGFTEKEKLKLLDKCIEIMKAVIPVHKKLMEEGKIEVTTTPFYHPILPLIYDTDLYHRKLPFRFSYPQDAEVQVNKSVEFHRQLFGENPEGMWPSEGSVAKEIIPIFADAKIKWIATDEQILAKSLGRKINERDKYRAYRARFNDIEVSIIFRDTRISDDVGFRYNSMPGKAAANDLIARLYDIHKRFADESEPACVSIIMDGENSWEAFKEDGKEFFHSLYSKLEEVDWIRTLTVSEFLNENPPQHILDNNLAAGSWINGNFDIWIGEKEENKAWDYLLRVRKDIENWENIPDKALEELYVAEGSDWFWWLGEDMETPEGDEEWDEMFRETLKNVYILSGKTPPDFLNEPIVK
ncbi:hypothetical protein KAX02_03290 [candidate division WOR-3 bacterium]|nr:hypothetical protein [candidate division WOR-3 bacterium]